jgi:alpha-ketoglutarate-dependent taurine dioxygenase
MVRVRPTGRAALRLNRYFAEVGARHTDVAMPAAVIAALDALDSVLEAPGTTISFLLEPGDGVFIDNATVLHNRTAYVDGPGHRRRLTRLWVR